MSTQTLKGFRDFLPEKMYIRKYVLSVLEEVFQSFGYQPLQTPTLEYADVLTGKYGEEADKLMYLFEDQGGRKVGLNYDLTVPTARVLVQYQGQIPLPFKRYQIQPAYRAENTQKGRYRQFIQCDVDSFGVSSPLADAEIIAVIYTALKKLNFQKFTIRINSRQVLFSALDKVGITDSETQLKVLQSIDKLDKKSEDEVIQELSEKGIDQNKSRELIEVIKSSQPDDNLNRLFKYLEKLGVNKDFYQFVPFIVRGLDYYTGAIYETIVEEPKIGSITGGGRYDKLVKQLGGPDIPATGTTLGFERICDVLEELGLVKDLSQTSSKVLVTIFSEDLAENAIEVSSLLRTQGVNSEVWLEPGAKLDKQFKYADQKGIPWAVVIGPDESLANEVTLKDLKSQSQERISIEELIKKLST
jgi:histidyl-tRNA synthetase